MWMWVCVEGEDICVCECGYRVIRVGGTWGENMYVGVNGSLCVREWVGVGGCGCWWRRDGVWVFGVGLIFHCVYF